MTVPGPADAAFHDRTLFSALLDAADEFGRATVALEDHEGTRLTYGRMVLGAVILGREIARFTRPGERVGLMLPNAAGAAVAFFALQAEARVAAMLNFSSGILALESCCRAAAIETVLTSRRFVEIAKLEEVVAALGKTRRIVYLDDLRAEIGTLAKITGAAKARFARRLHARLGAAPDDIAVMLFTSGTEGTPKGVALTHRNVLANCGQFLTVEDVGPPDRLFNALPVFHSFGITVGLVGPVVAGIAVMFYPSPLHYKQIPPLVGRFRATILVGTDTFAGAWARHATKEDFASLRMVVLGAEKVREPTRRLFEDKFGLDLLEGYGATEAAPVIAANTPEDNVHGSVGRLMPGMEYRIEPVPGLAEGGRLAVRGPNVMAGYMTVERPGELQAPPDGWHDTGDIVAIDGRGYLYITGRAKRFAKLGGEMVSLAAIEAHVAALWPDHTHAVVSVASARKGEELVLVTDRPDAAVTALAAHAKARGLGQLMVPKRIVALEAMPVLGTGKLDYVAIERLAREATAEPVQAEKS